MGAPKLNHWQRPDRPSGGEGAAARRRRAGGGPVRADHAQQEFAFIRALLQVQLNSPQGLIFHDRGDLKLEPSIDVLCAELFE